MAIVQSTTAARAADFVNSLGINTHIDFASYGYENLAVVEAAINYLGVTNIRDSAETPTDAQSWLAVARATGARFDDYIAETSPSGMATDLSYVASLAGEGILNYIEGGNEEDDAYPASLGNTLAITAQFQQQVYATGLALGLPVINMSFGAGWTPTNDYQGDYGAVGDLSAYTNYGNAHTYPLVGQGTDWSMQRLNGLAQLAASTAPVITSEIGWNESQGYGTTNIARYVLQAALDGMKDGDAKTYFYSLFDDGSGLFGLMNQDGTPKPAGTALHDLTTLLADTAPTAANFGPGALGYTLTGAGANDNALLLQKSDGDYWLALWNENDPAHAVSVTLDGAATEIKVFDPLTGTASIQDIVGAAGVTVSVSDAPLLVEILGADSGTPVAPPPPPAPTADDLNVTAPASETVTAGTSIAITGVTISDPWAASNPGTMTLNLWNTGGGTIALAGQTATFSGSISLSGTLAQLNADLTALSYRAGNAGGDSITVDAWNQAGVEAQSTIAVTVAAAPALHVAPALILIAASDATPVVNVSHASIIATAGDHMLFIGGSFDTAKLTGGTEQVQAYQGNNTITTGGRADTIDIGGAGNVVNGGGGANTIVDSGAGNTLLMPGLGLAAGLDQIFGDVLNNGDRFDFSGALKATAWNGASATIDQYLHIAHSGSDAIISVSAVANGPAAKIADLHGVGALDLATLVARSIL